MPTVIIEVKSGCVDVVTSDTPISVVVLVYDVEGRPADKSRFEADVCPEFVEEITGEED